MSSANYTTSSRNTALDGLRAFAITLIVASHCDFLNQGGLGNAIFFCLSGFLAAYPFSSNGEERFSSLRKWGQYYWNRIFRILPTFWVVVLFLRVTCGLKFFNTNLTFLKNLFFVESYGHLWFLQQEMVMYMILPFIMVLLLLLKRARGCLSAKMPVFYALCAVVLGFMACLSCRYLTLDVFSLNGNGTQQVFRIWQFLIGMVTAYMYKAYRAAQMDFFRNRLFRIVGDVVAFALILGCILSSTSFLRLLDPSLSEYYIGWYRPVLCSCLSGIAIFLLLANPGGLMTRFLGCRLFSVVGQISFGVYLIHAFLIPITSATNFPSPFQKFLFIYILSIGAAWVLHVFVEKPSGIFAKTKRLRDVIDYYKSL